VRAAAAGAASGTLESATDGRRPRKAPSVTIDVVVVNYRSGNKLAACLSGARTFLGKAQLIVVDNSPGDGSAAAARAAHPDLLVIENPENRGFAAAVNRGISRGEGEIVLLLNPDVSAIRGDRRAVEAAFVEDEHLAALGPRLLNADGTVQWCARREPRFLDLMSGAVGRKRPHWERHFYADEWDYSTSRHVDSLFGACLFLRRRALDDVGLFDERFFVYSEETDWLVRAKRRGWRTLYLVDVEAEHALRSSSDTGEVELSLLLLESLHEYARKHLGRMRSTAFRALLVGIDGCRWLLASVRGASKRDHRRVLERRLVLHITGRLEHPS
jgi:GT2 family glycosyltransferase